MWNSKPDVHLNKILIFCLTLAAFMVSSCGLALDNQAKLERGQKAFNEGEYRAAIIDAKTVLRDEPDSAAARLLLGRASVVIGDGPAAEKELRRSMQLGVDLTVVVVDLGRALILQRKFEDVLTEVVTDAAEENDRTGVMRLRGEALLGLQRPAEAREVFSEVLDIDESDLEAQLGIVNSYIGERNFLQARETMNHVLATDDNFIPALQLSGTLNMQMRNLPRAAAEFRKAAELARANADARSEMQALSGLADAIFLQEKPDETRVILERMREIAPENLRTMMTTARLAIADEDWTTAQENLQEILRRAPDFRAAQMLLGAVHKASGNLGQAEMYLSAVVTAEPDNSRARLLLAETRLQMNKADAARQALEPITSGADADVVSLSMAAGANLNLGDVDEAVELLERAVAMNPGNVDLKVQLAIAHIRGGQLDKARQVLESLPDMSGQPSEFRSNVLLIVTQMAQGDQDEALASSKSLLEEWPGRAEAYSLVGSIETAMGDLEAARRSFEQGLQIAPDNIRIIRYLAQLDLAEDDSQAAKERYLVVLELDPGDSFAMLSLARIAARVEDHDETRMWLEKAREADPKSINARSLLAALHLAFRDFTAAEKVAQEAVNLKPDSAKLQNYLGLAQYYDKNFREAIFTFGKAAELAPDEPSYRFNLARAQKAMGNNASAMVSLQDSMNDVLQHTPSAVLLASIRAELGDMDGAQEIARRMREMNPDDATPYVLEAELLAQQGDLSGAANAYDKALSIEMADRYAIRAYRIRSQAGVADPLEPLLNFIEARPLDTNVRLYLANAYMNSGEIGNANAQYESVLTQAPDNFIAANNLAWNYFTTEDARAEEFARRAYELRPDSSAVIDTLGWILVKKGDFENGIPLLRTATELSDNRPEIQFHLAVALAESGAEDEARSILEDLLKSTDSFSSREAAEALLADL